MKIPKSFRMKNLEEKTEQLKNYGKQILRDPKSNMIHEYAGKLEIEEKVLDDPDCKIDFVKYLIELFKKVVQQTYSEELVWTPVELMGSKDYVEAYHSVISTRTTSGKEIKIPLTIYSSTELDPKPFAYLYIGKHFGLKQACCLRNSNHDGFKKMCREKLVMELG